MASGTTALLFVFGGLFVLALCGLLVVLVFRGAGRRTVAGLSFTQPGPFFLALPTVGDGPAELWLRYTVEFPYQKPFGGQVSKVFCLVLELELDGKTIVFGHGGRAPQGLLEFEGLVHYATRFSPGSPTTNTSYQASVLVKRLPKCPPKLQGSLRAENGTTLTQAQLTLRR